MENLRDKKGRFKSRKQLAKLEQASILCRSGPDLKLINLEGNRIIEFEHLTDILKQGCYKCQKNSL